MKELAWTKSDTPAQTGTYIVALEYNNGMGAYSTDYWNAAEGWFDLDPTQAKIVAFVSINSVTDLLPSPWED